jgi:uncharacterized membrane protein
MNIITQKTTQENARGNSLPSGHKGQVIRGILAGMLPLLLAIPFFSFGLWSTGILIAVGGSVILIGRRRLKDKPVSSLDIVSLLLGVLVAIGFFGFGNVFFIKHFGVVIYGALLIQVLYGELRGLPFTAQYSKQMISSDHWTTRGFFEGNRFLSRFWGVIFVISILMAVFGIDTLVLIVLPNVLVVLALVFGPNIGHWYAIRFLSKS